MSMVSWLVTSTCLVAGCVCLFACAVLGLFKQNVSLVTAFSAVVLLIFGNFDRIQSFTLSPGALQATIRDVDLKIDQGKKLAAEIKRLAIVNAKMVIIANESGNALVISDPFPAQDAFKAKVLNELKAMDLSPQEIDEVDQADRDIVLSFYANAAFRFASGRVPADEGKQFAQAYAALGQQEGDRPLSSAQLMELYRRFKVDERAFAPYMEDFVYYEKNGHQRSPDVWHRRGNWGFGTVSPSH
jgi:hypothetical protein